MSSNEPPLAHRIPQSRRHSSFESIPSRSPSPVMPRRKNSSLTSRSFMQSPQNKPPLAHPISQSRRHSSFESIPSRSPSPVMPRRNSSLASWSSMQSPRLPGLIEVETSTSSPPQTPPPSSPVLETAEVTAPRSAVNKRSGTRQQPTARLPRYSQLSDGPRSDDDHNDVNWTQLNRLPRVARGLPPRYSTGRIPSDLPSECSDAAVESETGSPRSFSNFARAGGQATGIVFLFVATVQLVMGIIFSIVAAKARALAPEFDESYEWTGILLILAGAEGIFSYGCLKNARIITCLLLGCAVLLSGLCFCVNLNFALASHSNSVEFVDEYTHCRWIKSTETCKCQKPNVDEKTESNVLCNPQETSVYSILISVFVCNVTGTIPNCINFFITISLLVEMIKKSRQNRTARNNVPDTAIVLTNASSTTAPQSSQNSSPDESTITSSNVSVPPPIYSSVSSRSRSLPGVPSIVVTSPTVRPPSYNTSVQTSNLNSQVREDDVFL